MSKEIGRNEPCPCGSGLKFKQCCKGHVDWRRDKDGELFKRIPVPPDQMARLKEGGKAFEAKFGRKPKTVGEVLKFMGESHEDVIRRMKETGVDPVLVHAYTKTGMFVTAENIKGWSTTDLAEWQAAVEEGKQLVAASN